MRQSWFQRLAPVMEWSYITRSQIPLFALIAVWIAHYSWWMVVIYAIDGGTAIGIEEEFKLQGRLVAALLLGTLPLFLLGEWLRKRDLTPEWYQHLTGNYYGLWLVWGGYITGGLSFAAGVVLMGSPLIGFLFLQRRVVLVAIAVSFVTLLLCNLATATGALPYAPFLGEPVDVASARLWVSSHLMIAAPHIIFELALAALVIGQWRLRERAVLQQSLTDSLTGLHNRRSLLKQLVHELGRARRKHKALSLVLFDLDHFKQINDRHGHPVGDKVLQETARLLREEIRAGDTLARFGGEEFVLLLPHTDIDMARQIAERCRARLKSARIAGSAGEIIPISASFGVSWVDDNGRCNDTTLIADADAALYRAKENGRDRVEVADEASTFHQPYDQDDQQRHLPDERPVLTSNLKQLVTRTSVRRIVTNILSWTPVSNARMINALVLYILVSVYGWLLYLHHSEEMSLLLNPEVVAQYFRVAPLLFGITLFLLMAGGYVNRHNPTSRWYVMCSVNLLALSLVWIGYGIGILAMPTGILMLGTPIIGFLLFDRAQILQPLLTAQVLVVLIAYWSADGTLEYAALFARHGSLWEPHSMFFVTSYYLASILMALIALVLMNHILGRWRAREAEIRELSITDTLTHTHNRRSILNLLANAREQAVRQNQTLSLVIMDLDHFKRVNDTWGHPTGDKVLKESARVLLDCLRDADVLGRFGGEEFLILLPDTDQQGAKILAERCRQQLKGLALRADNGDKVPVSASFGICTSTPTCSFAVNELVKHADDALYNAKAKGRDCVVSYRPDQDCNPVLA